MDYGDAPREHLYTNQTHPYFRAPHLYVSFAMRFFPDRTALSDEAFKRLNVWPNYGRGECSDGVFLTSRGGHRYDRTFLEAFVRPGPDPGNWVSRSLMAALGVVPTGPAEMSLYYQQHAAQKTAHPRRHALRLDGFASVNAPYRGGEIHMSWPIPTFAGGSVVENMGELLTGEAVAFREPDGLAIVLAVAASLGIRTSYTEQDIRVCAPLDSGRQLPCPGQSFRPKF